MPILNKVGCTSGPCHGAAKGKNGFKLSLRGYDPEFDYEALPYDINRRRFNRADPARGGLRFDANSAYYKTILNWLSSGAPFGSPEKDKVVRLEVKPSELSYDGPGASKNVTTIAHYGDGSTRDVTRGASISANNTEVAEVEDQGGVKAIRKVEAALLVRYEGNFAWTALPQHNYIDQLIDAKLKRLKILPSPTATDEEFLRRVALDLTGLPALCGHSPFVVETF